LVPALTVAEQSTATSVLSAGTSTGTSKVISTAVGTFNSTPSVASKEAQFWIFTTALVAAVVVPPLYSVVGHLDMKALSAAETE
jgi:hypothetical protein